MNEDKINNQNNIKQDLLDKISKFCDKCGAPYSTEDLQIIKKTKLLTIIHFKCSVCKASKIVQLSNVYSGDAVQQIINTDLQNSELPTFMSKRAVTINDVIKIYSYLKKNKGRIKV